MFFIKYQSEIVDSVKDSGQIFVGHDWFNWILANMSDENNTL